MRSLIARLLLSTGLLAGLVLGLASATADLAESPRESRPAAPREPAAREPAAKVRERPHAVLLVLDELPGDSLLDASGRIDSGRYPNFAELAADSTWFRNAYSSYDSTTKAVPLILDGLRPRDGTEADLRWHPRSIFTALGRRRYRIVAAEEATALCPPRLCRGARSRRPAIAPRLNRGRPRRFNRFLRTIRPSRRPTFWMSHVLLPHAPYLYLPSGARTRPGARDPLNEMNSTRGFHDRHLTRHNEQRYLLQLGFVDRLLGKLLRRLKASGMYDDTLVLVTADHGYAWQVGVETRRSVSPSNVHELTPVPFLVKAPGQRRAASRATYVQTLDVAPTIADLLGVRLGYRAHGRSAFSRAVRRRRGVAVTTRDFIAIVRLSGRVWKARRRAVVRRRLRQLGEGDWASLYTGLGPNRALVGRQVARLARAAAVGTRASIAARGAYAQVRWASGYPPRAHPAEPGASGYPFRAHPAKPGASGIVPAQVVGRVRGAAVRRDVAVAVNGRIEGVGRTFKLVGDASEHFAVNVPESALRDGRNLVEVFEVTRSGRLRLLARS